MLNRYPWWKNSMIVALLVLGALYAAPNLYPPDPAVQITPISSGEQVSVGAMAEARGVLDEAGIEYFGEEFSERLGLLRLRREDQQLQAKALIQKALGDRYITAVNLAPTTPEWLLSMGANPMTLGLDLSGGVHFLLEVDMQEFLEKRLKDYQGDIKKALREQRLRYSRSTMNNSTDNPQLVFVFRNLNTLEMAIGVVRNDFPEFIRQVNEDRLELKLALTEPRLRELEDYALKQNLQSLRNRVNELGVAEPLVQRQGRNRIVVELPGVQDTAAAKKIIGRTANLEFRLEASPGSSPLGTETFEFRGQQAPRAAELERAMILTGDRVTGARPSFDENGMPQVNIELDRVGGARMTEVTRKSVGRNMGVLFVEYKSRTNYENLDEDGNPTLEKWVEKNIISLATIQSTLGNAFRITGLEATEASELALLLRAGALAAPVYIVEERTIGPSLGQENIELGVMSVQIGFALILVFMMLYYRTFGVFANVALAVNLLLLVAMMSLLGATLTLPGIAGIVLTVGMAVDANVLIFARIREELRNGLSPQKAIHAGYERAFVTILDANLTTLIVAVILFGAGTGPVKGFAVTLSIGIITSMFTAIVLTRSMVNLMYGGRRVERLSIGGAGV